VEPHVTVKIPFAWAGDPEGFLAPVRAACASVRPFAVRLGEPGRFPEAQVLYLTLHAEGLPRLHRAVMAALDGLVPVDPRGHEGEGYHPHLTLAVGRFGIAPDGLERMEAEARRELADLPAFQVESLRCYRREGPDDPWAPFADIPLGC
jgi:2'-5' RNA ligase